MPDLSIIIVNYNVKEFILNSLDSIKKSSDGFEVETIVIDNASKDGSVEAIAKQFPEVNLIASNENLGFGKANNLGLEKAKGKYILLLNPDTILKEDTIAKMIEFFEKNKDAGLAGCKVLNPDGTLQLPCRRSFPGPWTAFTKVSGLSKLFPKNKLFAKYNLTYLDENKTYEVDAVSGSFMMLRREVYEKIGGFDPQFFMYGEDLDLCYRVQKAGYKVYYVHSTEIIHYKGESTKRSSIDETKVFYDAMHLFVKKHLSSSFLVELILQIAIVLRKTLAFLNVYKGIITAAAVDFVLFTAAIIFAEMLYKPGNWSGFPEYSKPWVYILPAILQVFLSSLAGSYRLKSFSVLRSLISLGVGFILLAASTFFLKQYAFSRAVVLITYSLAFVSFSVWRIIIKLFFKVGLTSDSASLNTIIVGTNQNAIKLARKIKTSISNIYSVRGLISNDPSKINSDFDGISVIGSMENIHKIIDEYKIKNVIFTKESISFDDIFRIVAGCNDEKVDFKVAGNEQDYLVGKSQITMLEDIPLLNINYNISKTTHRITKRFFDLFLSFLFILFFPVTILGWIFSSKDSLVNKFISGIPKVFVGSKSIIGPKSSGDNELYLGKEGLTGLWFTEKFPLNDSVEIQKLNLYYAKNQNIWLDFEILGKSISKMLFKLEK